MCGAVTLFVQQRAVICVPSIQNGYTLETHLHNMLRSHASRARGVMVVSMRLVRSVISWRKWCALGFDSFTIKDTYCSVKVLSRARDPKDMIGIPSFEYIYRYGNGNICATNHTISARRHRIKPHALILYALREIKVPPRNRTVVVLLNG